MIITDLAVFRFHPETKRAFVSSIHPGVDPEAVVERAGFEVDVPGNVERTRTPDASAVALLREMDPAGVYLKQPKA
jgi:glutaconate CoA-transferase subunit B